MVLSLSLLSIEFNIEFSLLEVLLDLELKLLLLFLVLQKLLEPLVAFYSSVGPFVAFDLLIQGFS